MRLALYVGGTTILIVGMLWFGGLFDTVRALGEYLYPTTEEGMGAVPDCVKTNETPPADLMQIVENQRDSYHLTLQKVVVCRSMRRIPGLEHGFAGLPSEDQVGHMWNPLSQGCCGSRFGRHVIVTVGEYSDGGSIVVKAALIQSRADHLRSNWRESSNFWARRWLRSAVNVVLH